MVCPGVELIETDTAIIEPYPGRSFVKDFYRNTISSMRDEMYPMFKGRPIRVKQILRATKIYYYRRMHTDWEA